MGWSCTRAAGDTMDRWIAKCRAQSGGSQNTYTSDGETYFWEVSRTEHNDGAITGTIHRNMKVGEPLRIKGGMSTVQEGQLFCKKVGSFRIEPDGLIARAPRFFKA